MINKNNGITIEDLDSIFDAFDVMDKADAYTKVLIEFYNFITQKDENTKTKYLSEIPPHIYDFLSVMSYREILTPLACSHYEKGMSMQAIARKYDNYGEYKEFVTKEIIRGILGTRSVKAKSKSGKKTQIIQWGKPIVSDMDTDKTKNNK
jgi:hypothetical protein